MATDFRPHTVSIGSRLPHLHSSAQVQIDRSSWTFRASLLAHHDPPEPAIFRVVGRVAGYSRGRPRGTK